MQFYALMPAGICFKTPLKPQEQGEFFQCFVVGNKFPLPS
nr:hypothetical protein [uncultured bacterium]